jgi:hypothetical protein
MEPVLEIQIATPCDDMREQVTIERGVLLEQCLEIKSPLGGDELVESDLVRCNGSPLLLDIPMVRVRPLVTDPLENHCVTLVEVLTRLANRHRYDLAHEGCAISCASRFITTEGRVAMNRSSLPRGFTRDRV